MHCTSTLTLSDTVSSQVSFIPELNEIIKLNASLKDIMPMICGYGPDLLAGHNTICHPTIYNVVIIGNFVELLTTLATALIWWWTSPEKRFVSEIKKIATMGIFTPKYCFSVPELPTLTILSWGPWHHISPRELTSCLPISRCCPGCGISIKF